MKREEPPETQQAPMSAVLANAAETFQPLSMNGAQRARFDARLYERVAARRRGPRLFAAMATAVVAALALVWFSSNGAMAPEPRTSPGEFTEEVAFPAAESSWETEILLVDGDGGLIDEDYLPAEYEVIALAFLDGL